MFSDKLFVDAPFHFILWNDRPRFSVLQAVSTSANDLLVYDGGLVFSPGEGIDAFGYGFSSGKEYVVGVYTEQKSMDELGKLVTSGVVPIDEEGQLNAQIILDFNEPADLYYVMVTQDLNTNDAAWAGQAACYQVC